MKQSKKAEDDLGAAGAVVDEAGDAGDDVIAGESPRTGSPFGGPTALTLAAAVPAGASPFEPANRMPRFGLRAENSAIADPAEDVLVGAVLHVVDSSLLPFVRFFMFDCDNSEFVEFPSLRMPFQVRRLCLVLCQWKGHVVLLVRQSECRASTSVLSGLVLHGKALLVSGVTSVLQDPFLTRPFPVCTQYVRPNKRGFALIGLCSLPLSLIDGHSSSPSGSSTPSRSSEDARRSLSSPSALTSAWCLSILSSRHVVVRRASHV